MSNCGKDLRFQVKLAGTFVSLDGETSVSGTINREAADATAKSSMPWRDILQYCGLASATAKCSGFPVSGLTPSVWQALQTAARMGDLVECAIVHIDPVTAASTVFIRFFGLVTSFDRGGDKNAAETYTITVESSGVVSDSALILKVATPVFSPTGGTITTSDLITLTCATSGATVYYTIDGSTPSPTSAIDASKWIGSWSFDTDDTSSITGTPNLGSSFSGYPVTLASISGGVLNSAPSSESARAVASGISITTGSFAAFITQSSSVHLIYFGFNTSSAGAVFRLISDGRVQGAGITTGVFTPNYSSRYHLAATYDGTTVSVYKDGVLTYSGALTLGAGSAITGVYFGYASGAPARQVDSFIATREVLSASAVAALATGALPDASGRLSSGTYLYIAPFTLPASGNSYSVAWGDSGLKLSNQGSYLTSLIRSTLPLPTGRKIYFEVAGVYAPDNQNRVQIGVTLSTKPVYPSTLGHPLGLGADEYVTQLPEPDDGGVYVYNRSPNVLSGTAIPVVGTRIGILWDGVNGEFSVKALNTGGASQSVFSVKTGMNGNAWYLCFGGSSAGAGGNIQAEMFVTPASLSYSVPSGYEAGWSDDVPVSAYTTVKAIGVKASYLDSDVASATFTVSTAHPAIAMGAWAIWDASVQPDTDYTSVTDISGNNRTASQALNGGVAPSTASANGLHAFGFRQSGGSAVAGFAVDNSPVNSGVDFEVWATIRASWPGGNSSLLRSVGPATYNAPDHGVLYLGGAYSGVLRGGLYAGAGFAQSSPQPTLASGGRPNLWRYRGVASSNTSYLKVDSDTEVSLNSANGAVVSSSTVFSVGYTDLPGISTLPCAIMVVGEVIVFNRALTSGEASTLSAYLKAKWNTP